MEGMMVALNRKILRIYVKLGDRLGLWSSNDQVYIDIHGKTGKDYTLNGQYQLKNMKKVLVFLDEKFLFYDTVFNKEEIRFFIEELNKLIGVDGYR